MESIEQRRELWGVTLEERIGAAAAIWIHRRMEVDASDNEVVKRSRQTLDSRAVENALNECGLLSSEYPWVVEKADEIEADVKAGKIDQTTLRECVRRFHSQAFL